MTGLAINPRDPRVKLLAKNVENPNKVVKAKENQIKANFQDEVYFVDSESNLYVAEYGNLPEGTSKENISFIDLEDAEVIYIDDEADSHKITNINVSGLSNEMESFIKEKLDVNNKKNYDSNDLSEINQKLIDNSKGKLYFVSTNVQSIEGNKSGETELVIKAIEKLKVTGVNGSDKKIIENHLEKSKENLDLPQKLNTLSDELKNHPTKMLSPFPTNKYKKEKVNEMLNFYKSQGETSLSNNKSLNFYKNVDDIEKAYFNLSEKLIDGNFESKEDFEFSDRTYSELKSILHSYKPISSDFNQDNEYEVNIDLIDLPENVTFQFEEKAASLINNLNDQEKNALMNTFEKPLNEESIDKGMKNLNSFFEKKGIIVQRAMPNVLPDENGTFVQIDLSLNEMPKIATVSGNNGTKFDDEDIKGLFKKPYKIDNINQGIQETVKMVKDAGYVLKNNQLDVNIDNGELKIDLNLVKYKGIEVFGNDKTKSKVITREFDNVTKNEPLNVNDIREGISRVQQKGYLEVKTFDLINDSDGNAKVGLSLEEKKSNEFSLFGGYGSGSGLFGGGGITFGNLNGNGSSLSVNAELGMNKRYGGNVTYQDPWLFGDKVGFSTSVYANHWEGPKTDEMRIGNRTNINMPLGKDYLNSNWNLNAGLRSEYIKLDPEFSASGNGNDILIKPHIGLNFNNGKTKFNTQLSLGTGSTTYGQFDLGASHKLSLNKSEKLSLTFSGKSSVQIGKAHYSEQLNSFNYDVLGVANDGLNRGNLGLEIKSTLDYKMNDMVGLYTEAGIGGIADYNNSDSFSNFKDIGVGVGAKFMGMKFGYEAKIDPTGNNNVFHGFKISKSF